MQPIRLVLLLAVIACQRDVPTVDAAEHVRLKADEKWLNASLQVASGCTDEGSDIAGKLSISVGPETGVIKGFWRGSRSCPSEGE